MIRLGIDEFIRNIKRNIMIVVQLTAILILSILIVSVYDSQTRMSNAVMKYIDDTGVYYNATGKDASVMTDEELMENLEKVENIVHTIQTDVSEYEGDKIITSFDIVAYDENIVEYIPELSAGKWHDKANKKEGFINAIVSENAHGYSVGDVIEVVGYNTLGEEVNIKLNIVGTVSEKRMLFGNGGSWKSSDNSYLDMFSSAFDNTGGVVGVPNIMTVVSVEDIKKYDLYYIVPKGIIDFKDDIADEEMDSNKEFLKSVCDITDTASMAENSDKILFNKLSGIVIVFIVLCIITLTSIICSGAVTFLYERRNYGIYFITGNNWNNTIILTMTNWLCICISSVCLSGVIIGIGMLNGITNEYALSFTWATVLFYLIIIAITIATALIIPISMLRKNQPVQILKNNMEG